MTEITLENIRTIRLNSFRPLCMNDFGKLAIKKYQLPPYIDASCRREPDFENPFPSITSLCRQDKFAPHLRVNDIVVYMTVKGDYPASEIAEPHHRLIAILKVIKVFENHHLAAQWYYQNKLPLPSNCMIEDNPPKRYDQTAGLFLNKKAIRNYLIKTEQLQHIIGERIIEKDWDRKYQQKAETWKSFVITQPLYVELNEPTIIFRDDFINIFGKIPQTRMPNKIKEKELASLAKLVGLKLIFTV